MTRPPIPTRIPWHLIFIFALLSLGILITGYFFYAGRKAYLEQEKTRELATVLANKIEHLAAWRQERIADSILIMNDSLFAAQVRGWLEDRSSRRLKRAILNRLKTLKVYQYQRIALIDPLGTVRLSTPGKRDLQLAHAKTLALEALKKRKPVFSDLYWDETSKKVCLSLLIPLLSSSEDISTPVAVILMRLDLQRFLYAPLHLWPTSNSVETFLMNQEGNEGIYLEKFRSQDASHIMHSPIARAKFPLAKISNRGEGKAFESLDYRGVPVVGAMVKIPDSSWYLAAKIDAADVYAPLREQLRYISILLGALIAVAGVSVAFVWRSQQAQFFRRQYQVEKERRSLAQRYEYLTRYANDIILVADKDQRIVDANDRALQAYGYNKEELEQMLLRDLYADPPQIDLENRLQPVNEQGGQVFESMHQRRDSAIFPVEISSCLMEIDGEKYYQTIVRDITQRKNFEDSLKHSEGKLRTLTGQLLSAQEKGRRRLARELHDDLGQSLLVLKLNTQRITNQLSTDNIELKNECGELLSNIDGITDNVRHLSRNLSPTILEDIGLTAALKQLFKKFGESYAVPEFTISLDEIDDLFQPEAKISIYRIFQEALTNIGKYAKSTRVEVAAKCEADAVAFSVEDNGIGFDMSEIQARGIENRGMGLAAMEERVSILGGTFHLWSQKGNGTKINFAIPIPKDPGLITAHIQKSHQGLI